MKITLTEARLILERKEKELKELFPKRRESRLNVYKKKDNKEELTHDEHEFTVDELTERIEKIKKEVRKIRLEITKANVKTLTDYIVDGEKVTIQEAVYLIKQMKEEGPILKEMGDLKTTVTIKDPNRFGNSTIDRSYEEINKPTYDTKKFRKQAEKNEMLLTKLSIAIDKANFNTKIEVDVIEANTDGE